MHVPATILLQGMLSGNLPMVAFSAQANLFSQVLGGKNPYNTLVTTTPSGSVTVDDANLLIAGKTMGSHPPAIPDVQAGANVTVARNAQGWVVSSTGGAAAVDDASNILANRTLTRHDWYVVPQSDLGEMLQVEAFLPHPPRIPDIRAGANLTRVLDAQGATISLVPEEASVLGAVKALGPKGTGPRLFGESQEIDATRALLPHPPKQKTVRAGSGVIVTEDALGYTVRTGASTFSPTTISSHAAGCALIVSTTDKITYYAQWDITDANIVLGTETVIIWLVSDSHHWDMDNLSVLAKVDSVGLFHVYVHADKDNGPFYTSIVLGNPSQPFTFAYLIL